MYTEYKEYLDSWFNGLYDEIYYWKCLLSGELPESARLRESSNPNKKFELEEELPLEKDRYFKFVDIGSGAFSRCGLVTDKVIFKPMAIDPLADIYKFYKKEYNLENNLHLETGFVELLDKKYNKNSFDMVHMSNSLDHCFDAIMGIYQLINICKIGGKIILRHAENEAEKDKYQGLHQWNLSLMNPDKSFVIWRNNERYDICKIFAEYADFLLVPNIREKDTNWVYNKVVMTKKKDIVIPKNDYYNTMFHCMYSYLMETLLKNVLLDIGNTKQINNKIIEKKVREIKMEHFKELLKKEKVIIYGMGIIGKALMDVMRKADIDVVGIMDRNGLPYQDTININVSDSTYNHENLVIVTAIGEFEQIKKTLMSYGWRNVKSIEAYL